MCLARLSGLGLAAWVQGGEGRGGFCKGDMAEWTQELETFAELLFPKEREGSHES